MLSSGVVLFHPEETLQVCDHKPTTQMLRCNAVRSIHEAMHCHISGYGNRNLHTPATEIQQQAVDNERKTKKNDQLAYNTFLG